jgi:Flp pilus assembly protein TadB
MNKDINKLIDMGTNTTEQVIKLSMNNPISTLGIVLVLLTALTYSSMKLSISIKKNKSKLIRIFMVITLVIYAISSLLHPLAGVVVGFVILLALMMVIYFFVSDFNNQFEDEDKSMKINEQ